ncbi:hypothetical protein K438DRAFT_1966186 [Mycena galopus ATCC 62051]|nr:hypothetical protein K438DRAFT_1966186 [Mycena galopus ATCC 62051]
MSGCVRRAVLVLVLSSSHLVYVTSPHTDRPTGDNGGVPIPTPPPPSPNPNPNPIGIRRGITTRKISPSNSARTRSSARPAPGEEVLDEWGEAEADDEEEDEDAETEVDLSGHESATRCRMRRFLVARVLK